MQRSHEPARISLRRGALSALPLIPALRLTVARAAGRMSWFSIAACLAVCAGCGGEVRDIGEVGVLDPALVVCPAGATVEGIDVSIYQGTFDWGAVKSAGRTFAITRVGDGYYEDPTFPTNWAGIKSVGMVRGAYQYFRPGKDADQQADIVIRKLGRLGAGDLPATCDVEATDGQPPNVIADKVRRWADRVAAGTGKVPMIYTGKYFWNDNVKTGALAANPLWIAAWGPPCPDTPTAWNGWRFWQYSSTGRVAGIGGAVDLDKFNGSLAQLQAFAGGPDWAAKYVVQSWPLATMAMELKAGQRVEAYIELRNVGAKNWDGATRLATSAPRDRESPFYDPATWMSKNRLTAVSGTVPPGGAFRFKFAFRAPMQPGSYHEHLNLVQEGVSWFSDPGQGGPPDGQIEAWINVSAAPPSPDMGRPPADAAPTETDDGGADLSPEGDPATEGGCSCQMSPRPVLPLLQIGVALGLLLVLRLRRRR